MAKTPTAPKATTSKPLSFSERRAQIEAAHNQRMAADIQNLAQAHAKDARKNLETYIREGNDNALKELWSDWKEATRLAGGELGNGSPASSEGGRKRRTEEDKKKLGNALLEYFKQHGEQPASAAVKALEDDGHVLMSNDHIVDLVTLVGGKLEHNGQRGLAARYKLKK